MALGVSDNKNDEKQKLKLLQLRKYQPKRIQWKFNVKISHLIRAFGVRFVASFISFFFKTKTKKRSVHFSMCL